jgi:xylose isomerase
MDAIDLGVECGAGVYVFWGGREGSETDSSKKPLDPGKRFREALNYLCEYVKDQGYDLKLALEPKPNEPRGDLYLPTVGSMLGFIATLDYPEMVGVNPEVAHEHMAGLNFTHAVASAWDAGKLFHIDLNDQLFGRYDQDFRFGSMMIKQAFYLVKFLEDVGYEGSRHFDAHAFRGEDYEGVKDFARGCMRTYLILKEKAERYNNDSEIQALLKDINTDDGTFNYLSDGYSADSANKLRSVEFDRVGLGRRGLPYEKLDQLTVELLLGVR